jgi:hypothetical protein
MTWCRILIAVPVLAAALAGCGSSPVYREESFNPKSPYQYRVSAEVDEVCEAARLALLSQGYTVQVAADNQLTATKAFQPDNDIHAVIEFNVSCAVTHEGTTLYANALEKRFKLKKQSSSAGISVPSVGSISLPWGSTTDSLTMVSAETVSDPDFYKRYYDLVAGQLGLKPKAK